MQSCQFAIPADSFNSTMADYAISVRTVTSFSSSPKAFASTASSSTTNTIVSTGSNGLSGGALAAAILVPLFMMLAFICWWFWNRRRRQSRIHDDKLTRLQSHAEKLTYRGQYVPRPQFASPPTKSHSQYPQNSSSPERQVLRSMPNRVRLDPILNVKQQMEQQ